MLDKYVIFIDCFINVAIKSSIKHMTVLTHNAV